jgi:hypothetical protein
MAAQSRAIRKRIRGFTDEARFFICSFSFLWVRSLTKEKNRERFRKNRIAVQVLDAEEPPDA